MYIPVNDLGSVGIVADQLDFQLPPAAWTSGRNIRFRRRVAEKMLGHQEVYSGASISPFWSLPVSIGGANWLVYASLTAIGSWNGAAHADRSRTTGGAYSASADILWNGGVLNGIPVINNGVDVPQYWATIGTGTFENLPNWPSGYTCRWIVPFKGFLVALNINDGSTDYEHRVKWSAAADPGTIPGTWDPSDATELAGERDLADINNGPIVGGVLLGDQLIIYKQNAVWTMRFTGSNFVFNTASAFQTFGPINGNCVVPVPPKVDNGQAEASKAHFVATGDDLVVHDGQSVRSVISETWRDYISDNVDTTNWRKCFCCVNRRQYEIWFCYPTPGNTYCNEALVWNYQTGAVTLRDLPGVTYAIESYVNDGTIAGVSWNSDTGAWDDDSSFWNASPFSATARSLVLNEPVGGTFLQVDQTNQFDGTNYLSYLERVAMPIIGYDRQGQPQVDPTTRKLVTRLWPKMTGDPVNIQALVQEDLGGPVTYSTPQSFDPGSGQQYIDIDPPLSGRFYGIKIYSEANDFWKLYGYAVNIEVLGEH